LKAGLVTNRSDYLECKSIPERYYPKLTKTKEQQSDQAKRVASERRAGVVPGICLLRRLADRHGTTASRSAGTLVEYALILVLGDLVALVIESEPVTRGATRAAERFDSALKEAADSQVLDDEKLRLNSLKRAIAALKSLRGTLSSCRTANCAELKESILPVLQTALEDKRDELRNTQRL
jgi:hypothetical protein